VTIRVDEETRAAVIAANVELSARAASTYNETEPHYLAENIARVEKKLDRIIEACDAKRMLDLGCGTGFMIDIARSRIEEIHGVDISPEMVGRVDISGPALISLELADTAAVDVEANSYDLVTAYSFLHHLFDPIPTLATAARALRSGGMLYVDLEPNKHFWSAISALDSSNSYDPIIQREMSMVVDHHGVALSTGVEQETFALAEWGKTHRGGLDEDETRSELADLGFSTAEFFYEWFVGQGVMINEIGKKPRKDLLAEAEVISAFLLRAFPLSKSMFKYVGFVATKA
jgi:ubiquinone/menaquinone biosynthesis C-methylase UbiE